MNFTFFLSTANFEKNFAKNVFVPNAWRGRPTYVIGMPPTVFLQHTHEAHVSQGYIWQAQGKHAASACAGRARAGSPAAEQSRKSTPRLTSHGEVRRHSPGGVSAHFPGRCAASLELDVHREGSERVVRSPSTPAMISDHHDSHDSKGSCYGPPANV